MKRVILAMWCVLLAACSAHAARQPAARRISVPPGHLLIGAAAYNAATFTASTGIRPAILEHYTHLYESFDAAFAGSAEPLIQIEPRHVSLAAVAAGQYDGWFRSYAKSVAAYRRPVILGFAPEMNGPWYSWGYTHVSPAVYIAAWRHVVAVFRSAGAANVTWMWTVNVMMAGWQMSSPAPWWPGAAWVRLIGIDGYYYGASQNFANLFGPVIRSVRKLGHEPVLISETGAAPAAGKAAKIADLFAGAVAARLAGVVWFNLPGNRDWRLDDPDALAAFRAAAEKYGEPYRG